MASIGVVGMGKLGTPLAALFAEANHRVVGVDANVERVKSLDERSIKDSEPGVLDILRNESLDISFSTSYDALKSCDLIYVIVPTPSLPDGSFSNEYVACVMDSLGKVLENSPIVQTIVIVSTVMPGSTEGPLSSSFFARLNPSYRSLKSVIYSPEFIALGSVIKNLRYPDMILVGTGNHTNAESHIQAMHSISLSNPPVQILSTLEAEIVKIAINTFITMKITFANFIGEISRECEIDARRVCYAIGSDSRIGNSYLSPGLGFGGPCFPRDNRAFSTFASSLGIEARLSLATDSLNQAIPRSIARWVKEKMPKVRKVAILGISYKENSDVTEESQSIYLANELVEFGLDVLVHDPVVRQRPQHLSSDVLFVNDLNLALEYELIFKTVRWPEYDLDELRQAKIIELR